MFSHNIFKNRTCMFSFQHPVVVGDNIPATDVVDDDCDDDGKMF